MNNDFEIADISMEHAYQLITGKRTFEEMLIENEAVFLPFNPDDEDKETRRKVTQTLIEHYTSLEQYERCAELAKILE